MLSLKSPLLISKSCQARLVIIVSTQTDSAIQAEKHTRSSHHTQCVYVSVQPQDFVHQCVHRLKLCEQTYTPLIG